MAAVPSHDHGEELLLMKPLFAAMLMAVACIGGSAVGAHARSQPSRQSDVQKYAYGLALVQYGVLGKGDPRVRRFARALSSLAEKCYADKVSKLADYTVYSRDRLQASGLKDSYLTVLVQVNRAVPSRTGTCARAFTAYVNGRMGH